MLFPLFTKTESFLFLFLNFAHTHTRTHAQPSSRQCSNSRIKKLNLVSILQFIKASLTGELNKEFNDQHDLAWPDWEAMKVVVAIEKHKIGSTRQTYSHVHASWLVGIRLSYA